MTVSFACTRNTGGIDVGCSGTNVDIVKDVANTNDRLAEATIVVSIRDDGGALPISAPAPEAVARCHASRIAREQALCKEFESEQQFQRRLTDAREDYQYRMSKGLPPHSQGYPGERNEPSSSLYRLHHRYSLHYSLHCPPPSLRCSI